MRETDTRVPNPDFHTKSRVAIFLAHSSYPRCSFLDIVVPLRSFQCPSKLDKGVEAKGPLKLHHQLLPLARVGTFNVLLLSTVLRVKAKKNR